MAGINDVMDKLEDVLDKIEDNKEKIDEVLDKIENQVLHTQCAMCSGTGEITNPVDGVPGNPVACPQCGGDGTVKLGKIDTVADDEV